tara:strand:+ start:17164 stop:19584 length:2421 start_codon:yes stop_codon:yes gene_type:complete
MFDNTARTGSSAAGDYEIERSLRFASVSGSNTSGNGGGLDRDFDHDGDRQKWTYSTWFKRSQFGSTNSGTNHLFAPDVGGDGSNESVMYIVSSDKLRMYDSGATQMDLVTARVFRDPSAWYHLVVATDTTQATAANRVKIYVNGVQETSFSTNTQPSQNYQLGWNKQQRHSIGRYAAPGGTSSSTRFGGYMTESYFIDGQQLEPGDFAETNSITGAWVPKKYDGTYGDNGFYLNFSDNSDTTAATLGKDRSGNNNDWTPHNFSVAAGVGNDSVEDTPTNNWCVLDPINANATSVKEGALQGIGDTGNSNNLGTFGTFAMSSGKWYYELTSVAVGGGSGVGLLPIDKTTGSQMPYGGDYNYVDGAISYLSTGQKCIGPGSASGLSAYGSTWTTDDVIGVAFNSDDDEITFYKNGTSQGTITGATGEYFPCAYGYQSATWELNFGQKAFSHTAPTGFKTLCASNMSAPTIKNPGEHFNIALYTGTGAEQAITGVGFSPDLVWTKGRSDADNNSLFDTVRGVTKELVTNGTAAEATDAQLLKSFDSDGFTLGTNSGVNGNTKTYVSWNWRGSDSASASNSDGSISSTVNANTSAGFSIVTYVGNNATGATVGHGLNAVPQLYIIKDRDTAGYSWHVYHASLGATKEMTLDSGAGVDTQAFWNDTAPTSSVFTVNGGGWEVNTDTKNHIAYVFSEVEGFSKIGTWTGNGSTDGPFVWCGFEPAFLLHKRSSDTGPWHIFDNKRNTYNPTTKTVYPDSDSAEYTNTGSDPQIDFLANGFKVRSSYAQFNGSGDTLIWMAFAKTPFKYSKAY